jgi:hypothetical protein
LEENSNVALEEVVGERLFGPLVMYVSGGVESGPAIDVFTSSRPK